MKSADAAVWRQNVLEQLVLSSVPDRGLMPLLPDHLDFRRSEFSPVMSKLEKRASLNFFFVLLKNDFPLKVNKVLVKGANSLSSDSRATAGLRISSLK